MSIRLPPWTSIPFAAALLLSVVAFNGQPLVYYDTPGYANAGQGLVNLLAGGAPLSGVDPFGHEIAPGWQPSSSRSAWYGLLLHAAATTGDFWPVVIMQALIGAWLLYLLLRQVARDHAGALLLALTVLLLLTPAPFVLGFVMPDSFAAFAIVALALLVACPDGLRLGGRLVLGAIVGFSILAHSGHLALLLLLLPVAIVCRWSLLGGRHLLRTTVLPVAAMATAVALQALLALAQTQIYGAPPGQIPFLAARAVADGPGEPFLNDACAREPSRFALCRYLDDLPRDTADTFLWDMGATRGIYVNASDADRRAMGEEQTAVYVGSWLFDPPGMLRPALRNARRQFRLVGPTEFITEAALRDAMSETWPHYAKTMAGTSFWQDRPDPEALTILSRSTMYVAGTAVVLTLPWLLLFARGPRAPTSRTRQVALLALIIVAGLVANALVFGALSEPHHRYQARVAWLLPVAAFALAYVAMTRARRPRHRPSKPEKPTCASAPDRSRSGQ
ncbi:MAG: hypothetical protein RIM84_09340 [Alphaproteobacteria bacterium]